MLGEILQKLAEVKAMTFSVFLLTVVVRQKCQTKKAILETQDQAPGENFPFGVIGG